MQAADFSSAGTRRRGFGKAAGSASVNRFQRPPRVGARALGCMPTSGDWRVKQSEDKTEEEGGAEPSRAPRGAPGVTVRLKKIAPESGAPRPRMRAPHPCRSGVRCQPRSALSRKTCDQGFGVVRGEQRRPRQATGPLPAHVGTWSAGPLAPLPTRQAPNSFGAFDVLFPLPGTSHPTSPGAPNLAGSSLTLTPR